MASVVERLEIQPPAAGTDRRQEAARCVADEEEERVGRRLFEHFEKSVGAADFSRSSIASMTTTRHGDRAGSGRTSRRGREPDRR